MESTEKDKEYNMDWLNYHFPKYDCPYCGEDQDVSFDREDDGDDVTYIATCGRCGKSWGQAYHLVFDFNFKE